MSKALGAKAYSFSIAWPRNFPQGSCQPNAKGILAQSGSDAVSAALKTAQLATGKPGVLAFSGGDYHTCAVQTSGSVYCWGSNLFGELGNTSVAVGSYSRHAVQVQGLPSPATAIAVGNNASCAVLNSGAVYCWGNNTSGVLGNLSAGPASNAAPLPVQGLTAPATSVAIGTTSRAWAAAPTSRSTIWRA